ncbi:MAG: metalloregulator ArsR/SmtB family transcription factor [Pseudomonadales bacterium]
MPNQSADLNDVFRALADPTRRSVVHRLSNGPVSVSELAEPFDMALPSFVQHLKVLEDSGLIRSEKVGRVRTCQMVTETLSSAEQWLVDRRKLLEGRLDALAKYVERGNNMMHSNDRGESDG